MKFVLLLALLATFSAFAQTNTESAPAATQGQMGSPAAGEASMGTQEAAPKHKKHAKKAHHAKKKHHKKKKHQAQ